MYSVTYTTGFKKALKRCLKRGLKLELFDEVVNELRQSGTLSPKYKPHKLSSRFDNCWECLKLYHPVQTCSTKVLRLSNAAYKSKIENIINLLR